MNDLISWLRTQLDTDEQWALAASLPYRYADAGARAPEGGVHWRWVVGDNWETTTPDPVLNEFVTEAGDACWLVTVEEWPVTHDLGNGRTRTRAAPRSYADQMVEVDAGAAGHIIRHDPARVLRQVQAHRAILDLHHDETLPDGTTMGRCAECNNETAPCLTIKALVSIYSDRDGYKEEWSA